MNELINKVIQWGAERDLLKPEASDKQLIKIVEEVGELSQSHLRNNQDERKDAIGDIIVTIIIYARQNGLYIDDCLEHAYNEIKDRTGKTVNNTFIKDTK
jgi:NTP pyrophosphatase (non-canonical NTP hydrolase)